MTIILSQYVEVENDRFPHHIEKKIESSIIPNIGMSIEDSGTAPKIRHKRK